MRQRQRQRRCTPPRPAADDGFTLLEVVVAMAILGIIGASALWVGVSGMKDSSTLTQRQTAVVVATQALEQARGVNAARSSTGVSGLVAGRSAAAVTAQWAAVSTADEDLTWSASDPTLPLPPVAVPLSTTQVLAGQTYTVNTLIGTCYRLRTATSGAACTKNALSGNAEPTSSTAYVAIMRVIAVVSWKPPTGSVCPTTGCTYSMSELIDPSADLTWNPDGDLVANPDTVTVPPNTSTAINVLSNDEGTFTATNPVTITQQPASGTGTASVDSTGLVTFTPTGASYTTTLSYTVTGSGGSVSDPTTVTITVSAS